MSNIQTYGNTERGFQVMELDDEGALQFFFFREGIGNHRSAQAIGGNNGVVIGFTQGFPKADHLRDWATSIMHKVINARLDLKATMKEVEASL
jgi:hypothetical protein